MDWPRHETGLDEARGRIGGTAVFIFYGAPRSTNVRIGARF